jgi:hypothetical protein
MAGEYTVAQKCVDTAITTAQEDPSMSTDVMTGALLTTLLKIMIKERTRKDLASFIEFQLESVGEDEFVVTRGS